jgi:hypothetical protein
MVQLQERLRQQLQRYRVRTSHWMVRQDLAVLVSLLMAGATALPFAQLDLRQQWVQQIQL